MQFQVVDSKNLYRIGYRKEDSLLLVQFRNGMAYEYYDVPEWEYTQLLDSKSKGKYFAANIRNQYASKKTSID